MRPASREDAGLTVISSHRYSLAGADAGSTLTVSDSIFIDNRAVGGDGSPGGLGGQGSGGAIVSAGAGSLAVVKSSAFTGNLAQGGDGGVGDTGTGGGVFNRGVISIDATADRVWAYAKARLYQELGG